MVSTQVLTVLALLPVVVYGYTCHLQDSGVNMAYTECTTNSFCTKTLEFDNNNSLEKTLKGCDNGASPSAVALANIATARRQRVSWLCPFCL
ncbi:unnamed protein product [Caenorhabditis sp. 36 PRJEB53466]|nr:unnamed protein product [Caenorhabditis sp. 36 PRJEB53466]